MSDTGFAVGDVVVFNSGGPQMTVVEAGFGTSAERNNALAAEGPETETFVHSIIEMPAPVSEAQAEANLQTTDFETPPAQNLEEPAAPIEILLPPAGRPFKSTIDLAKTIDFVQPYLSPKAVEPSPAYDFNRQQWLHIPDNAAEIEKLQKQIDATNGRLNEVFARIEKYNRGASHKL